MPLSNSDLDREITGAPAIGNTFRKILGITEIGSGSEKIASGTSAIARFINLLLPGIIDSRADARIATIPPTLPAVIDYQLITTTGAGTYTIPAGAKSIYARGKAGGGGGGGTGIGGSGGGGGGEGQEFRVFKSGDNLAGQVISYSVGGGGNGGNINGGAGGGTTASNTTLFINETARGGGGGTAGLSDGGGRGGHGGGSSGTSNFGGAGGGGGGGGAGVPGIPNSGGGGGGGNGGSGGAGGSGYLEIFVFGGGDGDAAASTTSAITGSDSFGAAWAGSTPTLYDNFRQIGNRLICEGVVARGSSIAFARAFANNGYSLRMWGVGNTTTNWRYMVGENISGTRTTTGVHSSKMMIDASMSHVYYRAIGQAPTS